MDLKCPKCGSHDMVKASLAYAANTSQHESISTGVGMGAGGIGVGLGDTVGTSQTLLGQQLAPPAGSNLSGCLVLLGAGIVILLCKYYRAPWWVWVIGVVATIFLVGPLAVREDAKKQKLLEEYDRKWLCKRCGHIASL